MRVKPSALVAIGIWVLYAALVVGMQMASGISYDQFGESVANVMRAIIPSLAVGSLLLAGLAAWMGWFGAVMRDEHRTKVGWTLIAPVIYVVIIVANFGFTDWGNITLGFLGAALLLGILVGFAEEFLCRGILVVGLRGQLREVAVWLLTCLLFGVMHGLNLFQGQAVGPTLQQIFLAATQGSAFYIMRRYFGSLTLAMVLHGLWDMSIFVQDFSGAPASLVSLLVWVALPFAVVGGYVTARRTQEGPLESYAKGATSVPAAA